MALDLIIISTELDLLEKTIKAFRIGLKTSDNKKQTREDIAALKKQHKALKVYLNTIACFI